MNQKAYDLSMEIMRLQKLNMQFSNFPRLEDLYSKQNEGPNTFNYESTYDVSQAKNKILPLDNFNIQKFIDFTITEFDNLD